MIAERDDLALSLKTAEVTHTTFTHYLSYHRLIADDLLAAGYRQVKADDATVEQVARALAKAHDHEWGEDSRVEVELVATARAVLAALLEQD